MCLSLFVWLCVSWVYLWPFRVELPLTRRCVAALCTVSCVLNLAHSLQQMLDEKGKEADSEGWMSSVRHWGVGDTEREKHKTGMGLR